MATTYAPLKFGAFIPPQNKVGLNPHLAINRAIELIEHLDRLGFDEAWHRRAPLGRRRDHRLAGV